MPALVAGMIAGADSIDDMGLLRHGAMGRLFTGVRAPSTLGTFLRTFTAVARGAELPLGQRFLPCTTANARARERSGVRVMP